MPFTTLKFLLIYIFVFKYIGTSQSEQNGQWYDSPSLETLFDKIDLPKPGNLPMLNRKVFRGTRVSITEHPYVVSIRRLYAHYLTGTLLTKNLVLTIAHPIYQVCPSDLGVVVGENYADRGKSLLTVLILLIHQDFDPYTLTSDLALLRLYEDIMYRVSIKPISLTSWFMPIEGLTAFVTGWGRCDRKGTELCLPRSSRFYRGEKLDPMLRSVKFTVMPNRHCELYYAREFKIDSRVLCAGPARTDDLLSPCMAVPGAPLVVDARLAGVLSWGFGCGYTNDLPLIYTRLDSYHDWLIHNIPILRKITRDNMTLLFRATKMRKLYDWLLKSRLVIPPLKGIRFNDVQALDVDHQLALLRGEVYDIRDFVGDGRFHDYKAVLYKGIRETVNRAMVIKDVGLRNRMEMQPFLSDNSLNGTGIVLNNGTLLDDDSDEESDDEEHIEEDPTTTMEVHSDPSLSTNYEETSAV